MKTETLKRKMNHEFSLFSSPCWFWGKGKGEKVTRTGKLKNFLGGKSLKSVWAACVFSRGKYMQRACNVKNCKQKAAQWRASFANQSILNLTLLEVRDRSSLKTIYLYHDFQPL